MDATQERISEEQFYTEIRELIKEKGKLLKDIPEYIWDRSKKTVGYTRRDLHFENGEKVSFVEKHRQKIKFIGGEHIHIPGASIHFFRIS